MSVKQLERWIEKNPGARIAILSEIERGIVYWRVMIATADGDIIECESGLWIRDAAERAVKKLSQPDPRDDNIVNPYRGIFIESTPNAGDEGTE